MVSIHDHIKSLGTISSERVLLATLPINPSSLLLPSSLSTIQNEHENNYKRQKTKVQDIEDK